MHLFRGFGNWGAGRKFLRGIGIANLEFGKVVGLAGSEGFLRIANCEFGVGRNLDVPGGPARKIEVSVSLVDK